MPFFARLREMAAATAAPHGQPAGGAGLEVTATRVAAPPSAAEWHEPIAAAARPPSLRAAPIEPDGPWPAATEPPMVAAPAKALESRPEDTRGRPPEPAAATPAGQRRDRDRVNPAVAPPASDLDAPPRPVRSSRAAARDDDFVAPQDGAVAPHVRAAAPPVLAVTPPVRASSPRDVAATPSPARPAPRAARPLETAAPTIDAGEPARPARQRMEAAGPARPLEASTPPPAVRDERPAARRDPEERAREALVEVRRWMEEPPARGTAAPTGVQPPPVVEERSELTIGTIQVTVEAPPAAGRGAPQRSATAPPPRRDAVPRDYLRGW